MVGLILHGAGLLCELSRRSGPRRLRGPGHTGRVTWPCTRCDEEVPCFELVMQTSLVPPPQDIIRCILIQSQTKSLRANLLRLGFQSDSLRCHPGVLSIELLLSLSYLISQFCNVHLMLCLSRRGYSVVKKVAKTSKSSDKT